MSRQSLITLNYYLAFFLTTIPIPLSLFLPISKFLNASAGVKYWSPLGNIVWGESGGGTFNKIFRRKLRGFCLLCWVESYRLPTEGRRVIFFCHSLERYRRGKENYSGNLAGERVKRECQLPLLCAQRRGQHTYSLFCFLHLKVVR